MIFAKLPVVRTLRALKKELLRARSVTADAQSFRRLSADLVMYRFLRFSGLGRLNRVRTIHLQDGITVTYRLNRGDIQSIREVWLEDIYHLSGNQTFPHLFDMGANIGQASLYFAKKYQVGNVVAVEPNPANAVLARRNLAQNNIRARVVEAAVGPADGTAYFADTVDSNSGRLSESGRKVNVVSIPTLCSQEQVTLIDLLKIDIEGGEQALLTQENEWLGAVRTIVAEFHPDRVDYPGLVSLITAKGFARTTPDSFTADATEMFTRLN